MQEELLQKLVDNTSHKDSFQVILLFNWRRIDRTK